MQNCDSLVVRYNIKAPERVVLCTTKHPEIKSITETLKKKVSLCKELYANLIMIYDCDNVKGLLEFCKHICSRRVIWSPLLFKFSIKYVFPIVNCLPEISKTACSLVF